VNEKKVRRIMRIEGLTLEPCVQPPRVRVRKHAGKRITEAPDVAYQMDIKWVWCGRDGWAYLHNAIDTCTNEWLVGNLERGCGTREATKALDDLMAERFPVGQVAPGARLRVDNGPGFRSHSFIEAATLRRFDHELIQFRTPEDNGMIESLHAGVDRDYLNLLVFDSFEEADTYIRKSRFDYNHEKPMKRLAWLTPREYYEEKVKNAN
jgi:putative transposase